MTSDEAIDIAKRVAQENGWTWVGPGLAKKHGGEWEVRSHEGIGCLVVVRVDDLTGEIVSQDFMLR
jgi:hypothetical protein